MTIEKQLINASLKTLEYNKIEKQQNTQQKMSKCPLTAHTLTVLLPLLLLLATPASPAYTPGYLGTQIPQQVSLMPGFYITSPSGRMLVMQYDGNLVGYEGMTWLYYYAHFQTHTYPYAKLLRGYLQTNGNFVLYDTDNVVIWQTNSAQTTPNRPYKLRFNDNYKPYILDGSNNTIWIAP